MAHNTMIKTYVDHDAQIQFVNNNVYTGQPCITKNFMICDNTIRFISNGVLHIVYAKKKPYMVDGTTIVFSHDFNESLDTYDNIMRPITVLIFEQGENLHTRSIFNHFVTITKKMLKISFGYNFDNPIVLTKRVTHLIFGHNFSHRLFITKNIRVLSFGSSFNQPIVLTKNIYVLSFGSYFNQPIVLGKHVKYLTLSEMFRKSFISNKNLRHLTISLMTKEQNFLLEQITHLTIECFDHHVQDKLTNDIKELGFKYHTTVPMNNIPNIIKRIPIKKCRYVYLHLSGQIAFTRPQPEYIDI